jgi:hypothetical protein
MLPFLVSNRKFVVQHLKTLLNSNQELRPLLAKVQVLSALQRHFISVVPPHLAKSGKIQVLSLHLGTLTTAVANASVAAKLRQLAPELAVMMQDKGCEVSGIRVRVQVSFDRLQPKPPPHKLSTTAQKTLHEFGNSLDESPLKLALEKLANTNN